MGQVKNENQTTMVANAGQRRSARILMVEDYKNLQSVFSTMRYVMGFEVAHAENGLEALAAVLDSPPDLVLIDLQIPVLKCSSLAHFIREVSPATQVILITCAEQETAWKHAKSCAIDSVLSKPFDIIDFEKTIRGALDLKKAESPFTLHPTRRSMSPNIERNPVRRQGNRNIFCSFYKECLDDAIKESWRDWDCGDCPHKLNHQNEPDPLLAVTQWVEY